MAIIVSGDGAQNLLIFSKSLHRCHLLCDVDWTPIHTLVAAYANDAHDSPGTLSIQMQTTDTARMHETENKLANRKYIQTQFIRSIRAHKATNAQTTPEMKNKNPSLSIKCM